MQQKYLLVTLSIAIMWLAVLFVGVFGPDIRSTGVVETSEIPVVVVVAPCALVATAIVAWRGYRE